MFIFWLPIVTILGAFAYVIAKVMADARVRELEIRERIALIEKGLVPPPEVDPNRFDRAMQRMDRVQASSLMRRGGAGGARYRRAGVTFVGLGVGLIVLLTFTTGEASIALGVGGFLVVLGLAFVVNSLIDSGPDPRSAAIEPPSTSTTSRSE